MTRSATPYDDAACESHTYNVAHRLPGRDNPELYARNESILKSQIDLAKQLIQKHHEQKQS